MERHPDDLKTDEEIDAALAQAQAFDSFPRIVEAEYHAGPGPELLILQLNDGKRLLIPQEDLPELTKASTQQASDLIIGPNGLDVWWPQLDDGLYLPDFLTSRLPEHRWNTASTPAAA